MANEETVVTVLGRADHGQLLDDANDLLSQITKAVKETGGKGKLTISIEVRTVKKTDALELSANVKADLPLPTRSSELYFSNEDGRVSRKDPRQPDLPGTENVQKIRS